jgi:hypothetical protein
VQLADKVAAAGNPGDWGQARIARKQVNRLTAAANPQSMPLPRRVPG